MLLTDKKKRPVVVAWGAGPTFRRYYPLAPFDFDALVDADASKWGQKVYDFEVRPTHYIGDELAGFTVFVFVYSRFFQEIRAEAGRLGAFACIDAVSGIISLSSNQELELMSALLPLAKAVGPYSIE